MLEEVVQAIYFNSNSGFETALFKVFKQVLEEVIRTGHAPTVIEAQIMDVVQINLVEDKIVQKVLSSSGLVISIAENAGWVVGRALDECGIPNIGESLTATSGKDLFNKRSLPVRRGCQSSRLIWR